MDGCSNRLHSNVGVKQCIFYNGVFAESYCGTKLAYRKHSNSRSFIFVQHSLRFVLRMASQ